MKQIEKLVRYASSRRADQRTGSNKQLVQNVMVVLLKHLQIPVVYKAWDDSNVASHCIFKDNIEKNTS